MISYKSLKVEQLQKRDDLTIEVHEGSVATVYIGNLKIVPSWHTLTVFEKFTPPKVKKWKASGIIVDFDIPAEKVFSFKEEAELWGKYLKDLVIEEIEVEE